MFKLNYIILISCLFLTKEYSCLKCKIGFGISKPNSDKVEYFYDTSPNAEECGNDASANRVDHAIGCYKIVHKLSSGNLYVGLGCLTFAPTSVAQVAQATLYQSNYEKHIFAHVCRTDQCNGSQKKKVFFSLFLITSLVSGFKLY